jgi:pyruvate dehydrogenase E1 component
MPKGVEEGILKGIYKFAGSGAKQKKNRVELFGSGAILNETIKARAILDKYGIAANVWSVTSYKELHRNGEATDRWNMLHPESKPKVGYLSQCLAGATGPVIAASDYVKALPESVSRWCPRPFVALGTDGFGRSEGRAALRDFFEVDARFIALAALHVLAREGKIKAQVVSKAIKDFGIDPEKIDPVTA